MIVTVGGAGTDAGAAYSPPVETVPSVVFPPTTPFTLHVTALFVELATDAKSCRVPPACSVEGAAGLTDTARSCVTATEAVPLVV